MFSISRPLAGLALSLLITAVVLLNTATPAMQAPAKRTVKSVDVRILSTMLADEGFGEWGFAALVTVDGRRILFDTGANEDTVQRNLKALKLDLADVDTVILSHNHWDHVTGLMPLRRQYVEKSPKALSRMYGGTGIFWPRLGPQGQINNTMARIKTDYEATGGSVTEVSQPIELMPGVWLTGPVPRVHPERNWSGAGRVRSPSGDVEDTIPEDMALVIKTDQGLVFVFGCGHAGVINTLEHARKTIDAAPVKAIIGGLHLFDANDQHLAWTASQLKSFGVQQLVGAHCTGIEAVYRIRELAGLTRQTCMVGAVGASYSLASGINAGRVAK
jgi:7,8-dihydropterin-6-yl-methyl-4-(beta-D-ribofuranosyl)aminobenzene 5'-phosphate synthase